VDIKDKEFGIGNSELGLKAENTFIFTALKLFERI
jgi:hypothetical protein